MTRIVNRARRGKLVAVWFALILALSSIVGALPALAATPDYTIPNGWFFSQTAGGNGNGFAVTDYTDSSSRSIRFWSEFRRLGGVSTLGYPIGQPYVGSDGFTYQPFQRGVLQWRPEANVAFLSNTYEILQSAGKDDYLLGVRGIPRPISDDGSGGVYSKAVATRMTWLTDSAIKAKFLANPNPSSNPSWNQDRSIEMYGLPMSQPEKHGPFISQRFQRIAFQLWVEDVPGMPTKGTVVGILGGELLKETGLLPAGSIQPLGPNATPVAGVTPQPTALATAQPTAQATAQPTATPVPSGYSYRVESVGGQPNCGTTYIRAFVRDSNGNGMNGMTLKSWNDWGNEYIASTNSYSGQDGHWDRLIGPGVKPGRWYIALIDGNGTISSPTATVDFSSSCEANQGNIQEAEVVIRQN